MTNVFIARNKKEVKYLQSLLKYLISPYGNKPLMDDHPVYKNHDKLWITADFINHTISSFQTIDEHEKVEKEKVEKEYFHKAIPSNPISLLDPKIHPELFV